MANNKMSLVEIAKQVFQEQKRDLTLNELWNEVASIASLSPSEKQNKIVFFYTSLSTDGSFIYNKDDKKWALVSNLKVEDVKKNKLDVDSLDSDEEGDEEGEEEIIDEDELGFDDAASKELKKRENRSQDDESSDNEIEENL